jgi:hypothetical protein
MVESRVSLNYILRHTCNWCYQRFGGDPIYSERDKQEAFAFCSEECLAAMEKLWRKRNKLEMT